MLPPIEKLLEEFERITLDERVYMSFTSEEELEVCVQYRRAVEKPWSVWYGLSQEASKQSCSRQHIPFVLKAFKVSERAFLRELVSVLLTQAAYADEFVRQVQTLVGEEAVRNSINETQKFMDHMSQVVNRLLKTSESEPRLENEVKEGSDPELPPTTPSPTRGRLRVIRP